MTQRKADTGLDFEVLRRGIERCDPDLVLGFYAEDALLSIVNAGASHASTFELRGKAEIAKHLRAVYGQEASHRIEGEVLGKDRVTFREACEYPDGGRLWVSTTLEVHDSKIIRQTDVVAKNAPLDRERDQPSATHASTPTVAPPRDGRSSTRLTSALQAGNQKGGSQMMHPLSSVVKRQHPLLWAAWGCSRRPWPERTQTYRGRSR